MFALILAAQGTLVGVFAATDVFLFYVFFEAMLFPMYFLIGRFGGPDRRYAATKFFIYSLLGGLIMLGSVIGLYAASSDRLGHGTFTWTELQSIAGTLSPETQFWLFLGFFIAFAIKAPLVPLHTWLPDAGAEAPVGGGILLVGVLDKVGTFGFLRYCLPLFPVASQRMAPIVLTLAVIGILYGGILAIGQTDMKRFVAYTSIAHFGFIALGIFAFSTQAFAGPRSTWSTTASRRACCSSSSACSSCAAAPGWWPTTAACTRLPRCWRVSSCWRASRRSRCPAPTRSSASSWCSWAPTRANPSSRSSRPSGSSSPRCT